jgi:hypothetical protein
MKRRRSGLRSADTGLRECLRMTPDSLARRALVYFRFHTPEYSRTRSAHVSLTFVILSSVPEIFQR